MGNEGVGALRTRCRGAVIEMTDLPDEELVRRAQAGDDRAFTVLMQRHGEALRRHAERRLPPGLRRRVSVADVLQEARIVAHTRRGDFEDRGDGSFRNWLMRIVDLKVRDAVRDHVGREKRSLAREAPTQVKIDAGPLPGAQPTPSEVAVGAELADLAARALSSLPADYQEVFRLARHEGLTLREVADRMGRTREATKKLYGRALSRFTEELQRLRGETVG